MIRPLTEIQGVNHEVGIDHWVSHFTATCRDCGDLPSVAHPQTAFQAGLVQRRHLAEHLKALADEIQEASR